MSDGGENVVKTALGSIPVEALTIVKTYIDTSTAGALNFQGGYDAAANTPDLETPAAGVVKKGMMWAVTVDGLFFTEQVRVGDSIIANIDNPALLSDWTTVQSNIDLATTTTVGLASFSADNFAVSAAGEVTVKDNGIALGTETYGDYVQSVTVTDGLLGAVATEAGVAALQLDLGGIQTGAGTDFVMTDSGTGEDSYITPIASAAVLLNPSVTFAASLSATGDVTHNLATRDVIVQLFDTVTFDTVYADVTRTDASKVNVSFAAAPTNAVRVLISKVG
jgi:hypothetical protein